MCSLFGNNNSWYYITTLCAYLKFKFNWLSSNLPGKCRIQCLVDTDVNFSQYTLVSSDNLWWGGAIVLAFTEANFMRFLMENVKFHVTALFLLEWLLRETEWRYSKLKLKVELNVYQS